MNKKLLTITEKTIEIVEEYIKFTKKIEEKYGVRVDYNVDRIVEKKEKK